LFDSIGAIECITIASFLYFSRISHLKLLKTHKFEFKARLLMAVALVGLAAAGGGGDIYPSDHWSYSTKLTKANME
jgi:hypothetical protein